MNRIMYNSIVKKNNHLSFTITFKSSPTRTDLVEGGQNPEHEGCWYSDCVTGFIQHDFISMHNLQREKKIQFLALNFKPGLVFICKMKMLFQLQPYSSLESLRYWESILINYIWFRFASLWDVQHCKELMFTVCILFSEKVCKIQGDKKTKNKKWKY